MEVEEKKKTIDDFVTKVVLGKGTYAKVVLVKKKDNNKYYAMKMIKKEKLQKQRQIDNVLIERNVLEGMNHPFIIKLYYSFQTQYKFYFILEYCPGGELFSLLKKCQVFTEDQTRFYIAQIIVALEYLHSNDIIYRDLKPENVMIDVEGYIRITDFGLSKNKLEGDKLAYSICGTPEYMAPELLRQEGYAKPADWWTLGALVYECLTGTPPFYLQNQAQMFQQILSAQLQFPSYLSNNCINFIDGLLQKNPQQRLGYNGAHEVKQHPWLMNINWDILLSKQYRPPFIPVIDQDFGLSYFDDQFKNMPVDSWTNSIKDGPGRNVEGFTYINNENTEEL
ncbi:protein kinase domain protein [Ichthyophthirius multifiliis]|uniref:non-specific serine/threonine protein kinase n=1 Tax=Ichthyophthirius multifiliis TaxID=5932 RepID=G0QZH9_ICHMU|nr:protein kinase domain protein [Ichthyophthirius multifiliis]EGR29368.1 protein kinase domain protein [Ichthyophthirius multifiliis]|eukprot:XP_004030604.1 protein kinase domain protein [Ichthyophthirius multifiliis]